jgi:opacity protein-like surface antigen
MALITQSPTALGTVCVVLALGHASPALAQSRLNGPYLGLSVGALDLNNGETELSDIEFDTGYAIGGKAGYQFDHFRLEGELDFQFAEGTSSAGVNADIDIVRFTGGGYVDLPLGNGLVPYVGAGLGGASLSASGGFDDDDTAFTWHGEAGLAIGVTNQLSVVPAYRYEWIDTDLGNQTDPLTGNVFSVSIRYVFNPGPLGGIAAPAYRSPYYDRYPGSYYRRPYYEDPFYRPRYPAPRKPSPSPQERERDRCGWDGPGCPPDDESWDG